MPISGKVLELIRGAVDVGREIEDAIFPTLEEEADATVWLNPDGLRSDGYWLAVSACFGLISNRDLTGLFLPNGFIGIEYSAHENVVRFVCRQISSWKGVLNSIRDPAKRYTIQLFGGPKNEIYGGPWQWYAGAVPGIPSKGTFGNLGYENRAILTQFPTYADATGAERVSENPVPPFDDQSRGVAGIAVDPRVRIVNPTYKATHPPYPLFNALAGPCSGGDVMTSDLRGSPLEPQAAELKTKPVPPTPIPDLATAIGSAVGNVIVGPQQPSPPQQ